MKRKKMILFALLSVLSAFIFGLCVRIILFFAGDIVSLFDDTIGDILKAWKNASVEFSIPITLVWGIILCGVVYLFVWLAKGRTTPIKILCISTSVILGLAVFFASLFFVLWTCRINAIPFSVIFEVVTDILAFM